MLKRSVSILAAAMMAVTLGPPAKAAHSTVTVSAPVSTRDEISGTVAVKNNIAPAQTGKLTLLVLEATAKGVKERARLDLGTVMVGAGAGTQTLVPFTVDAKSGSLRKGVFVILADYDSSVIAPDGTLNRVPHTHCGTVTLLRDFDSGDSLPDPEDD